ncbi:HxlR family transcriptional regulator protein (plasmid) [Rhizobium phaseoli]|uniref:winged helix-turn-helix transcriptional regulator n=1 Tax=Rhizobium phaseoli TaxID=396 RepID=UPI0007EB4174|nr:helix-turn-helix domain-containing protein [Rhizobium phaseoli]ANL51085.1 HxlR family transcriptional regulator protein [Rhizobium phaseoli]
MALKIRRTKAMKPSSPCPISECMKLLGGAWTPNVIWYLSGGPRRFGELRNDIPDISPKMLSARLHSLEATGVIRREIIASSPPSAEYVLTELGSELLPIIDKIVEIGSKLRERRQAA